MSKEKQRREVLHVPDDLHGILEPRGWPEKKEEDSSMPKEDKLKEVLHVPDDLHGILEPQGYSDEQKEKEKKKKKKKKEEGKKKEKTLDTVVLHHLCPVCKYETDEVCRVFVRASAAFADYIFIKELNGRRGFIRMREFKAMYCPNCGVWLSTDVCERKTEYTPENGGKKQ